MAANSKGRAIAGSFGKRLANQIWTGKSRDPAPLPSFSPSAFRGVAHYSSSYDKNVEDQVIPAVVPDYMIEPESDKYWGPHPNTGVFGPADPKTASASGGVDQPGFRSASAAGNGGAPSALDQTAWFRPLSLEDVDKPPHA